MIKTQHETQRKLNITIYPSLTMLFNYLGFKTVPLPMSACVNVFCHVSTSQTISALTSV